MSCKTRPYFGQENGYARVKVDSATSSLVVPILCPKNGHTLGPFLRILLVPGFGLKNVPIYSGHKLGTTKLEDAGPADGTRFKVKDGPKSMPI